MSNAFNTPAMQALRQRLAQPAPASKPSGRRPNLLRVWNGNEAPILEQLVAAVPPTGGLSGLVEDMQARNDTTTMETNIQAPARPRERRLDRNRPQRPFSEHIRELQLPDGRRINLATYGDAGRAVQRWFAAKEEAGVWY